FRQTAAHGEEQLSCHRQIFATLQSVTVMKKRSPFSSKRGRAIVRDKRHLSTPPVKRQVSLAPFQKKNGARNRRPKRSRFSSDLDEIQILSALTAFKRGDC